MALGSKVMPSMARERSVDDNVSGPARFMGDAEFSRIAVFVVLKARLFILMRLTKFSLIYYST